MNIRKQMLEEEHERALTQSLKGVCPGCGRCKECGQPYPPQPYYVNPYPFTPGWPVFPQVWC